jgi:RNA polymerase sigma factor (sigma-70 family)
MRNANSGAVAEVHTLFHFGAMGAWTDDRLVAQFLSGRAGSDAAFRVLLGRHGPMVLGVCRRTLGDSHLAEDAFQATFLVLVKKAWAIRDRDLLANWLYGVAQRVSKKAKAQAERRRVVERDAAERTAWTTHGPQDQSDLRSIIDEEVRRLPERYRVPLVLCHLEGLTHHEVARRLGCPVGTIESRLSRARERLRSGLSRRGVAPASTALAAVLAPSVASAAPAHLIEATLRAATGFAVGRTGAASATALALAEQGLGFKPVLALGVKVGTLFTCVGLVTAGLGAYQAGGPPAKRPNSAAEPPPLAAQVPPESTRVPEVEAEAPATDQSEPPTPLESLLPEGPDPDPRSRLAIATPLAGISIDGRLDDWPSNLTRYPIDRKLQILSNYDRRAKGVASDPDAYFMAGYDPEEGLIYVAVVVQDDDLVAGFADPMHTDAVEVYVDGLCSERSVPVPAGEWMKGGLDASTMPVLQYAAVPGNGAAFGDPKGHNPSLVYGDVRKTATRMRYHREGDVTTYEWAIQAFDRYPGRPTQLEPGKRLGFDVAVVDKDRGDAPPAWFYWGPHPRKFKGLDAGNLGELVLGTGP